MKKLKNKGPDQRYWLKDIQNLIDCIHINVLEITLAGVARFSLLTNSVWMMFVLEFFLSALCIVIGIYSQSWTLHYSIGKIDETQSFWIPLLRSLTSSQMKPIKIEAHLSEKIGFLKSSCCWKFRNLRELWISKMVIILVRKTDSIRSSKSVNLRLFLFI